METNKIGNEIKAVLQHTAQIPGSVWAACTCIKDVESEFVHKGPTPHLQHLVERLIAELYEIKRIVGIAESHLNNAATSLGWTVDYNEDRDSYEVTGPCSEDWE